MKVERRAYWKVKGSEKLKQIEKKMTIFYKKGLNSNRTSEERIRETLNGADRDGDGRLTKEELKQAFRQLGSHAPDWRVFRCLRHVDANKDGLISASEFDALVKYAASKFGYK